MLRIDLAKHAIAILSDSEIVMTGGLRGLGATPGRIVLKAAWKGAAGAVTV
jgi:hypothetical protein